MARVTVMPAGVQFDIDEAETVMRAAQRAGLRWPTVCEGLGDCQVCFIERFGDDPGDDISRPAPGMLEQSGLEALRARRDFAEGAVRLACQFAPGRDVTVRKRGVL
jgi:ferredoxin, 2Fe-2S